MIGVTLMAKIHRTCPLTIQYFLRTSTPRIIGARNDTGLTSWKCFFTFVTKTGES